MAAQLTVVLDPGHITGYNKGVVPGYAEGNMTWKLANFLKEALARDGVRVIITRPSSNVDLELYSRGQVAVKNGAEVFISLHSNAISDTTRWEKAYGVSLYRSEYLPESTDLGNKLVDAIVGVMRPVTGVTFSRGVLTRLGSKGSDYYGVIRGAVSGARSVDAARKGPVKHAFIIEHGFHTHSKECAFLNDDSNLRTLAEAEATVIKEHFGVTGVANIPSPTPLQCTGGGEKDVWEFCKKKGLSDIAAASVCAQVRAEGVFNSCNLQNSYEKKFGMTDQAYVAAVDANTYTNFIHDKAGFGLFQVTFWSRKQGLYNLVKSKGVSIGDFQTQLEFFWVEVNTTHKGALTALKSMTDLKELCDFMTTKYESPADQSSAALNKRYEYAKEYLAKFAGTAPAPEKPTVPTPVENKPAESTPKSVIGKIKVIYEGADGLNIHTTPEWGTKNLNTTDGPVHGGIYRVVDKVKVGGSIMYELYSGAGFITGDEKYVTFTPAAESTPVVDTKKNIEVGSIVTVLNPVTYSGGTFKLWHKNYDVISISGDRVVIGKGNVVTCAIHVSNLCAA